MWPKYPAQLYLDTPNYSARIGGTTSLWPFPPNRTKRASEQASKRASVPIWLTPSSGGPICIPVQRSRRVLSKHMIRQWHDSCDIVQAKYPADLAVLGRRAPSPHALLRSMIDDEVTFVEPPACGPGCTAPSPTTTLAGKVPSRRLLSRRTLPTAVRLDSCPQARHISIGRERRPLGYPASHVRSATHPHRANLPPTGPLRRTLGVSVDLEVRHDGFVPKPHHIHARHASNSKVGAHRRLCQTVSWS